MFDSNVSSIGRQKLSVAVDRHLFVNVRSGISQEVSPMSTVAAAPRIRYSASPSVSAGRDSSGVRLTRRGRVALLVVFLGVAFAALTMLGGHSAATGEAGRPVETRTIVVGEGDTLWDIASDIAEPGATQEMIHYIEELNSLPGPSLMQGQKLAVPVS